MSTNTNDSEIAVKVDISPDEFKRMNDRNENSRFKVIYDMAVNDVVKIEKANVSAARILFNRLKKSRGWDYATKKHNDNGDIVAIRLA